MATFQTNLTHLMEHLKKADRDIQNICGILLAGGAEPHTNDELDAVLNRMAIVSGHLHFAKELMKRQDELQGQS